MLGRVDVKMVLHIGTTVCAASVRWSGSVVEWWSGGVWSVECGVSSVEWWSVGVAVCGV